LQNLFYAEQNGGDCKAIGFNWAIAPWESLILVNGLLSMEGAADNARNITNQGSKTMEARSPSEVRA
jgi:hypothetical protein